MLDAVREYLPISGLEWDLVAQRHMAYHPEEERSGDQLKKKFNKLAKTKMGTGDPNIPADVQEAKAIRKLIIEKSEGVTGSEEEFMAVEELDDVAELDEEEADFQEETGGSIAAPAVNGIDNGSVNPDMSTTGEREMRNVSAAAASSISPRNNVSL
jgi:hypothetical protein